MARHTRVELDLAALRHNAAHARTLAGSARVMAVVKADAYGHGATTVASCLEPLVDALAVACLEEALELREAGIGLPILLLEGVFDSAEMAAVAQHDLWLTITSEQQLCWLEEARTAAPIRCWLKVDTGMNRLGVYTTQAAALYDRLRSSNNAAERPVLFTHFSSADNPDSSATRRQMERFAALPIEAPRSAANSAALLALPGSHLDWVRPGYMLYGNSPLAGAHANTATLQPVMTFASRVIALKDVEPGGAVGYGGTFVAAQPSRIAVVAAGYGDGYPRRAPNRTPVLVDGRRAPLAGRVSMDMLTVDVTGIDGVALGSDVTLWGTGLPVDEVARHTGTLGYELTTRLTARPRRIVTGA
ncbi:MAG: alanine racemase [Halioglobus sp.]|nr:alanine racemase [Halioglobus sp.]